MVVEGYKIPPLRVPESQNNPNPLRGGGSICEPRFGLYGVHATSYSSGNITMTQEEIQQVIDATIKSYRGDISVLETAIGALYVGLKIGWKPLRLVHSHRTFASYQKVLGLDFHEVLPEVGPLADKSMAWRIAKHARNFWDVARGTLPGRSKEMQ